MSAMYIFIRAIENLIGRSGANAQRLLLAILEMASRFKSSNWIAKLKMLQIPRESLSCATD
jgi:hypothetical protein